MEEQVDQILDKVMATPGNLGCLLANNQGLCIGARGNASEKSAGIIVAISEQASQLDPNCNAPVVSMEVGDKLCIIHKNGITGAVYKQK
ncbi:ragulator complex protein LAMTOR5 homolog [Ochlerotatus camptorhynchus]|uniref:ragulator complex protein LAMTOR5 homolog n=1 Tax=Ochlerotatus camptorhynchus TaxID=644619 RepID=UPI0031E45956